MTGMRASAAAACSLLALAGCFSPGFGNGELACTAGECPPGLECHDGMCYRPGTEPDPDPDPEPEIDAGIVAASCRELRDAGITADGEYVLTRDGETLTATCDMTTDGGGWTLCARTHPIVRAQFATSVWSTATGFGIDCQALTPVAAPGAYRVTTVDRAIDALYAPVTPASFDQEIALAVGAAADPLVDFYSPEFCGGDRPCGKHITTDGKIEKFRVHGCGPAGNCNDHDHLFYGTLNASIDDFFEIPLSTNFTGVWRYLYQHGACEYEPTRACFGSFTEDADASFDLAGLPVYHWVR